MKHILLFAAVFVVLAGCDKPPSDTKVETAVAAVDATSESMPSICQESSGYQLIPSGITLHIPYHLRVDRIYNNKQGKDRRRVVLEYLDGDVDATLASVGQSLVAAGFSARPRRDAPNGNIVVPYAKKGFGNITVVANPLPGATPSNPLAKGTVALDFPLAEAVSASIAADASI